MVPMVEVTIAMVEVMTAMVETAIMIHMVVARQFTASISKKQLSELQGLQKGLNSRF